MPTELQDQKIIYEEDKYRAVYQENYGNGGQIYDFTQVICQRPAQTEDNLDPSTFESLPKHPVEVLASQVRNEHINILEELNLKTPNANILHQKVRDFLEVKEVVEENAPADEPRTNFIQDLDRKASMQPKPVGRMFGNIYGAEIKDWPMY